MPGPLNYTTTITADKTAGFCLSLLARAGASAVAVTYADKQPDGLSFRLQTPHGFKDFALPVNVHGVLRCLNRSTAPARLKTTEQARRVAWRIVKDWLEAQLAIIEAQMVTLDEIMLPYLQVDGGGTLYQAFQARESALQLTAGGDA